MAITFAQLKQAARERADMTESNFVTDSELGTYINASIAELHDILVETYEHDYYIKEQTFNTTAQTASYDLSTIITDNDFYKMRGVDLKLNGDKYFSIQPFNFNERNKFQDFGAWSYLGRANIRYRLVGSNLNFTPVPDSAVEVRLWYVPLATKLVNDADELNDLNQYSEYVIVDAAIKMLNKEESDVRVLLAQKEELKRRIESAAKNRDAGSSDSIQDIYTENDEYLFGVSKS